MWCLKIQLEPYEFDYCGEELYLYFEDHDIAVYVGTLIGEHLDKDDYDMFETPHGEFYVSAILYPIEVNESVSQAATTIYNSLTSKQTKLAKRFKEAMNYEKDNELDNS